MTDIRKLIHFVKPYWRRAVVALVLLTSLVFMDLAIPRLIQRIIDQGIKQNNLNVVIQTSLTDAGHLAAQHADRHRQQHLLRPGGRKRGPRPARSPFLKIQSFSYGNLDRFTTGQADGAPDQRRRARFSA